MVKSLLTNAVMLCFLGSRSATAEGSPRSPSLRGMQASNVTYEPTGFQRCGGYAADLGALAVDDCAAATSANGACVAGTFESFGPWRAGQGYTCKCCTDDDLQIGGYSTVYRLTKDLG
mmetsp:Transcript_93219/g.266477  ORF Transcript_93219/g.266477 Transcript_93219/m.266477 type:complete len:118 (-) Transcript_93219:111-464(-)|eukprot:CAMPEP_0119474650 /NCGR_PEP_ID=MMETSP1344-20130328/5821_1 /TAXON_ID=236787 /ORGANISM="Florenciella parvula, Strain CCMP2471" /LENGTH=117 /DNA_ID=CAMNT_0007507979 /DNA_START=358 /DNA_END=711 /DNA_ORIENTATION=+